MDRQPPSPKMLRELDDKRREERGEEITFTEKAQRFGEDIKEKGSEMLEKTKQIFTGEPVPQGRHICKDSVIHPDYGECKDSCYIGSMPNINSSTGSEGIP